MFDAVGHSSWFEETTCGRKTHGTVVVRLQVQGSTREKRYVPPNIFAREKLYPNHDGRHSNNLGL